MKTKFSILLLFVALMCGCSSAKFVMGGSVNMISNRHVDSKTNYELLFTVPLGSYDLIKKEFDITIIGHITAESEGANLVTTGGSVIPLQAQGWNPLMN